MVYLSFGREFLSMEPRYRRIDFQQAKQMLDSEPEIRFFDVREEDEYLTGHAEGALLFPLGSIDEARAAEAIPSLDTPVLLYCRSGARSHQAALRLISCGYRRVFDLGALNGWPYGIDW